MSASVRAITVLCRAGSLVLAIAASSPIHGQTTPTGIPQKSDQAAVQAMRNVMAQSGGEAQWRNMRSAEESFSILAAGQTIPRVAMLLDDWSSDDTRYRRRMQGQSATPEDHNGASTFSLKTRSSQVVVPEFDQARMLVPRLPAAAAEVMLRRPEYILKISQSQKCKSSETCIDVYRTNSSGTALEQQWKLSTTTGLPETIRYRTIVVGDPTTAIWRELFYMKYAQEDGITIPVSFMTRFGANRQNWTFVSLKQNSGFDTDKFDREAAQ